MTVLTLARPKAGSTSAVVEAAYSIAADVCGPIRSESIARALAPVEEQTLDETLLAEALRRHGWSSLAEAIYVAREALRAVLGEGVALEHRGGSHWRVVVRVGDERALAALVAEVRAGLRRWAPHHERVVVVGSLGNGAGLGERVQELLDGDATADLVAVVG